jgi:hypothetical protein
MYLLAKVHKTPWKTRAIISGCGCTTEGIAHWVNQQLQPICKDLPSYLQSSFTLKKLLKNVCTGANGCRLLLFTADAVSMYTNINTAHALPLLAEFLWHHPIAKEHLFHPEPVIEALAIIMKNNIFKFDDCYFHQLSGTAMGTPPAPPYATIYFAILELAAVPEFKSQLLFYKRYIDDVFGIWIHDRDPEVDITNWNHLKQRWNTFGNLRWTFEERSQQINFLDMTICLQDGHLSTKLFEKPENIYAYLPPFTCHPPGIINGLITGEVTRALQLTSTPTNLKASFKKLFARICAQGHNPNKTQLRINAAILKFRVPKYIDVGAPKDKKVFFHIHFHPQDPPRSILQQLFKTHILHPLNKPVLQHLQNQSRRYIETDHLVVAYHHQHNLKNLLFPRNFRAPLTGCASSYVLESILTQITLPEDPIPWAGTT